MNFSLSLKISDMLAYVWASRNNIADRENGKRSLSLKIVLSRRQELRQRRWLQPPPSGLTERVQMNVDKAECEGNIHLEQKCVGVFNTQTCNVVLLFPFIRVSFRFYRSPPPPSPHTHTTSMVNLLSLQ